MNKSRHLLDCTLWTVCMHLCVHVWIVDMYRCMPIDLLSKHTHTLSLSLITQFVAGTFTHGIWMSMQNVFVSGKLMDSVAWLYFFFFVVRSFNLYIFEPTHVTSYLLLTELFLKRDNNFTSGLILFTRQPPSS